jgi:hypothetical protein
VARGLHLKKQSRQREQASNGAQFVDVEWRSPLVLRVECSNVLDLQARVQRVCHSPIYCYLICDDSDSSRVFSSSPWVINHSRNCVPPPSAPSHVLSTPTPKGARLASNGSKPGATSPLSPRRSSAPDKSGPLWPGRKRVRICLRTDSNSPENRFARCMSSMEVLRRI